MEPRTKFINFQSFSIPLQRKKKLKLKIARKKSNFSSNKN